MSRLLTQLSQRLYIAETSKTIKLPFSAGNNCLYFLYSACISTQMGGDEDDDVVDTEGLVKSLNVLANVMSPIASIQQAKVSSVVPLWLLRSLRLWRFWKAKARVS